MIIETELELLVLGSLHALLYDDQNRPTGQSVGELTIFSYFKKIKPLGEILKTIDTLFSKEVITAKKTTLNDATGPFSYSDILPTEQGEKLIKATIEKYWVYLSGWESKYPSVQFQVLPELNDLDDWDILKVIYRNTTWRNAYQIDDDQARLIVDGNRKKLPYYGKFLNRTMRINHQLFYREQRQNDSGTYVQVLKFQPWYRPIVLGDFEAFNTAGKYYRYFSQMYPSAQHRYLNIKDFLKLLKKSSVELPDDLDSFFEHMISLGLLAIVQPQPNAARKVYTQVALSSLVDSENWEEWEAEYLNSRFMPQAKLFNELRGGNSLQFDFEINEFKIKTGTWPISTPPELVVAKAQLKEEPVAQDERKKPVVFVVHGRDEKIRTAMFDFLKSLGLDPWEWSAWVKATGRPSPYIGDVLNNAFTIAQAIVVLFTPDDDVKLREEFYLHNEPEYEKELTPQARPNVIFEAGMALAHADDRTIIVEFGDMRPFSDILGRHVVRMNNTALKREELISKLETAKCAVDKSSGAWKRIGNFELVAREKRMESSVEKRLGVESTNSKSENVFRKLLGLKKDLAIIPQAEEMNYSTAGGVGGSLQTMINGYLTITNLDGEKRTLEIVKGAIKKPYKEFRVRILAPNMGAMRIDVNPRIPYEGRRDIAFTAFLPNKHKKTGSEISLDIVLTDQFGRSHSANANFKYLDSGLDK